MKKIIFIFAALMIMSSPVHAQVRLNGGADVGASFIVNPDRYTAEEVSENVKKLTPNLLNYPVTKWCVSKDGTAFKTLKKERACLRVTPSQKFPQGIACRDANITLEVARAVPVFQSGTDTIASWQKAPAVFEVLTVDETMFDLPTLGIVKQEPINVQVCK